MTNELHEKAMGLAKTYRESESELLNTLVIMGEENLFNRMGYTGTYGYVLNALKLGEAQAHYFSKVSWKARVIPELREAITKGGLSVSMARRICPVIEKENCTEWIHAALHLKQRALEEKVSAANPRARVLQGIKPVAKEVHEMRVPLTSEEREMIEKVQDLVSQRTGKAATLQDTLREMALLYLERNDPVKKAERSFLRKGSAVTIPTPLKNNRSTQNNRPIRRRPLSAEVKHAVNLRSGYQCSYIDKEGSRCASQRWLHYHHRIPVSAGGVDSAPNISLICSAHHRMIHALRFQKGEYSRSY